MNVLLKQESRSQRTHPGSKGIWDKAGELDDAIWPSCQESNCYGAQTFLDLVICIILYRI